MIRLMIRSLRGLWATIPHYRGLESAERSSFARDFREHHRRRRHSARRIERFDGKHIPRGAGEIRLFSKVRDEDLRLPFFLDYYRCLGVDRFFFVDNGSTDSTVDLLLDGGDDVHVFGTNDDFWNFHAWIVHMLDRFGRGRWCVIADADEILAYPDSDRVGLAELTREFDADGVTALRCLLLDMYSDGVTADVAFEPGDDPFETCAYFDSDYRTLEVEYPHWESTLLRRGEVFVGGTRGRVFDRKAWISKIPLIRHNRHVVPFHAMHLVDGVSLAEGQGVLFHFKYLQTFEDTVRRRAARERAAGRPFDNVSYARKCQVGPLRLHHAGSHRYEGLEQLIALGLMKR